MSKLAALAAKRRQKENARPLPAGKSDLVATDDYASSLKALRISSPAPARSKADGFSNEDQIDAAVTRITSTDHKSEVNLANQSESDTTDLQTSEAQLEPGDLKAQPSLFASTILGAGVQVPASSIPSELEHTLLSHQTPTFNFTGPSPEDVVTMAQAAKGPR
jgi:hypothetical protein